MTVDDARWLSGDENRAWRAFLAAGSGVTSAVDALLKADCGISLDDYEVLVHLSEAPEHRVRMSELSHLLLHSRSRLSQRVDRLVHRGYVAREKCDDDARGTWAVLTAQGLVALTAAAPVHVEHVRTSFFSAFAEEELQATMRVLERLAKAARD